MLMKTGFICFFGVIFIFVIGQTSLYAGETFSIFWRIISTIVGIPTTLFLWLSLTTGGDVNFVERLPLPHAFREIIIYAGRGYREGFPWMYRK